jgi:predicted SAM-dependent methyltransferase
MKVILGCGEVREKNAVHVDIVDTAATDVVHDLNVTPWPLEDEAFDEAVAQDIVEHLTSLIAFMDECWRILRPGGKVTIRTPHCFHQNSWIDPTHKQHFHPRSFEYFDPTTEFGNKYGFYTVRKWRTRKNEFNRGTGNIEVVMEKRDDA